MDGSFWGNSFVDHICSFIYLGYCIIHKKTAVLSITKTVGHEKMGVCMQDMVQCN